MADDNYQNMWKKIKIILPIVVYCAGGFIVNDKKG